MGCGKKITGGAVSKALGGRWHQECFKCATCDKPIKGSFLTKDGKAYHKDCYNSNYGLKCEVCNDFIVGHILKYNGKAYHYTCLKCAKCGVYFTDGEAISVKGGEFVHNACKAISRGGVTKGNNNKVKENAEKLKQEPEFQGELGEFERECMNQHNLKRPLHSAGPLTWSEECAEHARKWVQHLVEIDTLAHDNESGMGENCGYFQSSNVSSKSDSEWAINVSNMWYGEIEKYDFDKSGYQSQTGHFTQMIWKSTTKMGCAIAKKGTKVYIVANYYPPGNFMSRYAENVSKH